MSMTPEERDDKLSKLLQIVQTLNREEGFKEWLSKKYDESTVDDYINGLKQIWDQSLLKEKRESPYKFGEKEIDKLNELKLEFEREWKEKNGNELDEVGAKGLDSYIEYLNSLNSNKKSKESNGDEYDDGMDEDEEDNEGDDNMDQPKNIILYGPPGTGKTYSTILKAMQRIDPGANYDENTYDVARNEFNKLLHSPRLEFITFHQSYSYEDFIEGIKAKVDGSNVIYDVVDGIFKKFCENARKEKDENGNALPCVFIIDEINRGNISKIFGELITLIEDTKREGKLEELSAILPYSGSKPISDKTDNQDSESKEESCGAKAPETEENSGDSSKYFTVPSNVYIIGTMNTADRSLAVVDTALRRRFTFEEMMPKPELVNIDINDGKGGIINIKNLLTTMNKRITVLCDREHTIGHSFFMELKDKPSINSLADIMKNKIIPLLQEYFYEDYENIRLVLGDNQKEEEPEFIKQMPLEDNLFGKRDTPKITEGENIYFYEINEKAFKDVKAYAYLGCASHMNDGTSSSENPASETAKNDTGEKTPGEGNE